MSDDRELVEPCPFCRTEIQRIGLLDKSGFVGFHPDNDCVLSGCGIAPDKLAKWNTRITPGSDLIRDALEPFALLYGEDDDDFADDTPVTVRFGRSTNYSLTLADIRRAVAALTKDDHGGGQND